MVNVIELSPTSMACPKDTREFQATFSSCVICVRKGLFIEETSRIIRTTVFSVRCISVSIINGYYCLQCSLNQYSVIAVLIFTVCCINIQCFLYQYLVFSVSIFTIFCINIQCFSVSIFSVFCIDIQCLLYQYSVFTVSIFSDCCINIQCVCTW